MSFNVTYGNHLAQEVWQNCLDRLKQKQLPYEGLLESTNVYLGENPRPHIRSNYRGYYAPARKDIVVTENGFYMNTEIYDDEFRKDRALRTLLHEIGHHVHFSFLPVRHQAKKDPGLWKDWSAATGFELEFKMGGQHDTVKSYEDFANDFKDWVIYDFNDKRDKFYYGLWGQQIPEEEEPKPSRYFKDVGLDYAWGGDDSAIRNLDWLYEQGLISGVSKDEFDPDREITRYEKAQLMKRMIDRLRR